MTLSLMDIKFSVRLNNVIFSILFFISKISVVL